MLAEQVPVVPQLCSCW